MNISFPNEAWLTEFKQKLNTDEQYNRVAGAWEGDMKFIIEPSDTFPKIVFIYLDLWHGKCRDAYFLDPKDGKQEAAFTLQAPYDNYVRIIKGELDPMQAMLTRKLQVKGNMAYMLRNVPVVLDFVRCMRESTRNYL
jgi:putative sterol carrier protein